MMFTHKLQLAPAPAALTPAEDSLRRSLALAYAALDELKATDDVIGAARTRALARTLAHAHLDDVVELLRRARELLTAIVAGDRAL
jgi:hypothetical protein